MQVCDSRKYKKKKICMLKYIYNLNNFGYEKDQLSYKYKIFVSLLSSIYIHVTTGVGVFFFY